MVFSIEQNWQYFTALSIGEMISIVVFVLEVTLCVFTDKALILDILTHDKLAVVIIVVTL